MKRSFLPGLFRRKILHAFVAPINAPTTFREQTAADFGSRQVSGREPFIEDGKLGRNHECSSSLMAEVFGEGIDTKLDREKGAAMDLVLQLVAANHCAAVSFRQLDNVVEVVDGSNLNVD